jgi:hypothetical protein
MPPMFPGGPGGGGPMGGPMMMGDLADQESF